MSNYNQPAILALTLLIIIFIIVVVALSYNPAPVRVTTECRSAKDLLECKTKDKQFCMSSMTPPVRNQLSPASTASPSDDVWSSIDRIKNERALRKNDETNIF